MAVALQRIPFSPPWIRPLLSSGRFRNDCSFKPVGATPFRLSTSAAAAVVESPETAQIWESMRKKKVVMRVGYVGSDYKGLQIQRHELDHSTIEGELEKAIFKAGGIRDSNYGNLNKINWARSSRTDKGVHSLATMIAFKMEIPEFAWNNDPNGFALARYVNSHLPENIRVFSILPSQRSFDARRECSIRKYTYLLPADVIGVKDSFTAGEIDRHLSDFNDLLNTFEAAPRQGKPGAQEAAAEPNNILFIQNLPDETNSMMLELLFKQYPGFREVRMVEAKPGIAFVEFEDDSQSSVAMQDLQGFKITAQDPMAITYAKK